jgi:glycosyltransferase involved in cell wall biosynthesis
MRLLVVSHYFWPENFRVNDLVAEMVARGHEVTVLTGKPNYPDGVLFPDYAADPRAFTTYAGARVIRVPMTMRGKGGMSLMVNYLTFALSACSIGIFRLRRQQFDATFVFGASPVTVALPAILVKWLKRTPVAFWVLDLWPQSLQAVGAVNSPAILSAIGACVGWIYRRCDLVLAQSRSFVPQISQQLKDPSRVIYFANWSEAIELPENSPPAPEVTKQGGVFDIVFAGNIGAAQDFPAILEAAVQLRDEPVRWLIVGDGRKAEWVQGEIDRLGLASKVVLLGRFPLERMPSFYRCADALLVSLRRDPIFALTIPGKLQSYLAAGIPVLAMLDGEGGEVVRASGAGLAAEAGDAAGLAANARRMMAASSEERAEMGRRGRDYSQREFDRTGQFTQLERILADVTAKARSWWQRK